MAEARDVEGGAVWPGDRVERVAPLKRPGEGEQLVLHVSRDGCCVLVESESCGVRVREWVSANRVRKVEPDGRDE